VEYEYDAFSRQMARRVTDSTGARELARVWTGPRLIEEWEDDKAARSIIYADREPLQLVRSDAAEPRALLYTINGRAFVTGLADDTGHLAEAYSYGVFGEPFLAGVASPLKASPLGNLIFARMEP
jgi:hypothetical protein